MNEENLINYYNKFNEDKRLTRRHGQVEFITTIKYIEKILEKIDNPKILDIGAGSGRYSFYLVEKGYDVTAIELVKHNLRMIEEKSKLIKAYQGNAIDLSRFDDNTFDLVLLFGPMYHLINEEDQLKALSEAKRVSKGVIMVAYIMNDYGIITHGFKEKAIKASIENNLVDSNYHITPKKTDLYNYVRLEDVDELNKKAKLKRKLIFTPDGPANYIRPYLNSLDHEEFNLFLDYHFKTCERMDMMGASAHIVDIIKK